MYSKCVCLTGTTATELRLRGSLNAAVNLMDMQESRDRYRSQFAWYVSSINIHLFMKSLGYAKQERPSGKPVCTGENTSQVSWRSHLAHFAYHPNKYSLASYDWDFILLRYKYGLLGGVFTVEIRRNSLFSMNTNHYDALLYRCCL